MSIFSVWKGGDAKRLEEGNNITLTNTGKTVKIASTGASAASDVTVATITHGVTTNTQACLADLVSRVYALEHP